MPFMNQAPSSRQCMRCWRTNSYDSLYSLALKLLQGTVSALTEQAKLVDKGSPDGNLAHDVVLHLELLHLPVAHRTVLALEELLFDLMPGTDVLPLQGNLHPEMGNGSQRPVE